MQKTLHKYLEEAARFPRGICKVSMKQNFMERNGTWNGGMV